MIARRNRWTIIPDGPWAANLVGLSTQVPAKIVYLSVSGGGRMGHNGGVVRARPRMAGGGEWPRLAPEASRRAEAFVMSF